MNKVMRVKHDFDYPDFTVEKGTLLIVTGNYPGTDHYFIKSKDNHLAYRTVHKSHLEEVDVFAMDEQIKDLRAELQVAKMAAEIVEADEKRAVAAADRLQDNVVQLNSKLREARQTETEHIRKIARLRREIRRLQDEVDDARSNVAVKVSVPREIAEAIEHYRAHGYLNLYGIGKAIYSEKNRKASEARRILEERYEDHQDVLMKALVNGYTVEGLEESLQNGILQTLKTWDELPDVEGDRNRDKELSYAAELITEFVLKNNVGTTNVNG